MLFRVRTPETVVAAIRQLWIDGIPPREIARRTGVSVRTVHRYSEEVRPRRHEARRPLFDPYLTPPPTPTITAALMGDPFPGRREIMEKARGGAVLDEDTGGG